MGGHIATERVLAVSDVSLRIRIAATGDLHIRQSADEHTIPGLKNLRDHADVLIITGDITENGRLAEADVAAAMLREADLPVVAVLGNHDLRSLRRATFRRTLERAGIEVLDGTATTIRSSSGARIGIAGATGSGGGFWPLEGPDAIHNRTFRRLAVRAARESTALERGLLDLNADLTIVATHYAPTASTLGREPLAKYWMLGNCELGAVIDRASADLVVHGHAHLGILEGRTPGGIPVRNVALPVVGRVHLETLQTRWVRDLELSEVQPVAHAR